MLFVKRRVNDMGNHDEEALRLARSEHGAEGHKVLRRQRFPVRVDDDGFEVGVRLAFAEAVNQWIGIGENLHAGGIRKLVMLNAHGGNSPLMTIVATELRTRLDMLAVATSWTRFGLPEGLITPEEKALDIHGGFIETSVMLALRPDLVDMSKARNFSNAQSRYAEEFKFLRAYGPHAFGWKMHDLNPEGVAGNAAAATAEAGEKLLANAVTGFIDLLRDVDRFELARFKSQRLASQAN